MECSSKNRTKVGELYPLNRDCAFGVRNNSKDFSVGVQIEKNIESLCSEQITSDLMIFELW